MRVFPVVVLFGERTVLDAEACFLLNHICHGGVPPYEGFLAGTFVGALGHIGGDFGCICVCLICGMNNKDSQYFCNNTSQENAHFIAFLNGESKVGSSPFRDFGPRWGAICSSVLLSPLVWTLVDTLFCSVSVVPMKATTFVPVNFLIRPLWLYWGWELEQFHRVDFFQDVGGSSSERVNVMILILMRSELLALSHMAARHSDRSSPKHVVASPRRCFLDLPDWFLLAKSVFRHLLECFFSCYLCHVHHEVLGPLVSCCRKYCT
ncbi:uncharacterized protein G2W53_041099 [Senna tora]|uniref:Uncharacterized protein n=1 Tax=Senna tora TaxID=362788 RepID=A0A834SGV3_9FABA|nr:uncharacterized protein G2W53_041099 [Senna tora]